MTVTDRTDATDQEFRDRVQPFEDAATPPEVREAAIVEEVARAIRGEWLRVLHGWDDWGAAPERVRENYRRLAAAAVAAYRATQDGGAEEAVRRPGAAVVALAWHDVVCPESVECRDRSLHAASQTIANTGLLASFLDRLAALAPQAGEAGPDWFALPGPEPTGPLTGGLITPENPVGGLRPASPQAYR